MAYSSFVWSDGSWQGCDQPPGCIENGPWLAVCHDNLQLEFILVSNEDQCEAEGGKLTSFTKYGGRKIDLRQKEAIAGPLIELDDGRIVVEAARVPTHYQVVIPLCRPVGAPGTNLTLQVARLTYPLSVVGRELKPESSIAALGKIQVTLAAYGARSMALETVVRWHHPGPVGLCIRKTGSDEWTTVTKLVMADGEAELALLCGTEPPWEAFVQLGDQEWTLGKTAAPNLFCLNDNHGAPVTLRAFANKGWGERELLLGLRQEDTIAARVGMEVDWAQWPAYRYRVVRSGTAWCVDAPKTKPPHIYSPRQPLLAQRNGTSRCVVLASTQFRVVADKVLARGQLPTSLGTAGIAGDDGAKKTACAPRSCLLLTDSGSLEESEFYDSWGAFHASIGLHGGSWNPVRSLSLGAGIVCWQGVVDRATIVEVTESPNVLRYLLTFDNPVRVRPETWFVQPYVGVAASLNADGTRVVAAGIEGDPAMLRLDPSSRSWIARRGSISRLGQHDLSELHFDVELQAAQSLCLCDANSGTGGAVVRVRNVSVAHTGVGGERGYPELEVIGVLSSRGPAHAFPLVSPGETLLVAAKQPATAGAHEGPMLQRAASDERLRGWLSDLPEWCRDAARSAYEQMGPGSHKDVVWTIYYDTANEPLIRLEYRPRTRPAAVHVYEIPGLPAWAATKSSPTQGAG